MSCRRWAGWTERSWLQGRQSRCAHVCDRCWDASDLSAEERAGGILRWSAIACEGSASVSTMSSNYHQNLDGVPGRRSCHEPGRGGHVCGDEVDRKKVRRAGGLCYGGWGSSAARWCLGYCWSGLGERKRCGFWWASAAGAGDGSVERLGVVAGPFGPW